MGTEFWWGNLKERGDLEDLDLGIIPPYKYNGRT